MSKIVDPHRDQSRHGHWGNGGIILRIPLHPLSDCSFARAEQNANVSFCTPLLVPKRIEGKKFESLAMPFPFNTNVIATLRHEDGISVIDRKTG